jgi:hypothetical protein
LAAGNRYLHYDLGDLGPNSIVEVTLDHAANVQLMDSSNYDNYRSGRQFRYVGGYVKQSPYLVTPPRYADWHLVIDLGGAAGTVRASARVIRK